MSQNGVKDVALVPADASRGDDLVLMFERLAKDPAVDVEKLERLIAMNERILAHNARAAFHGAFAQMQADLPEISEKGEILNKDGSVRSRYARLEDIQQAVKPVLRAHGFAIRHRTEWPEDRKSIIRIVGILSHVEGHSEESVFEAPMDKSDYRTDIQSMGSTVSYGRRYTTIDVLNITTRGLDKDGAKPPEMPDPPDGFAVWWIHIQEQAGKGMKAFEPAWETSEGSMKTYAMKYRRAEVKHLQATAAKGGK